MRPHRRSAAFTLIEAIIAVSMGMLIVYTLYSAIRTASVSATAANRLSIENRLFSTGVLEVLDRVDYWSDMDRPGWQPCRTRPTKKISGAWMNYDANGADSLQLAQPFTPFAESWTTDINELPAASNRYDGAWLPHDPRTWYRGDGSLWLKVGSAGGQYPDQSAWGNYGLFSGSEGTVTQGGAATTVGAFAGSLPVGTYTWYASQHKGLKAALGFYGWWDYLPANALIDWYDRDGGRAIKPYELANRYTGRGGDAVSDIGRFAAGPAKVWSSGTERPLTRSSYLYEQVLGICAPRPAQPGNQPLPADDVNAALRLNRWMGGMKSFGWESQGAVNRLMKELTRPIAITPYRPAHWPHATTDVRRYRIFARSISQCFVRMINPISGEMVEINFRVSGTSLRGARLQRGLDD